MPFEKCSSKYDICHLFEKLPLLNLKQLITILTAVDSLLLAAILNYQPIKGEVRMENKVVELDVREDIKNKLEPFQKIMSAVSGLDAEDVFILHAPFKPIPLFGVLKAKGFEYKAEEIDKKHWKVIFTKSGESK